MSEQRGERYFLKRGEEGKWAEVSKDEFRDAEREAGFTPEWGAEPGELATSGFGSFYVRDGLWLHGRIVGSDASPDAYDVDPEFRDLVWPDQT